MTIDEIKKLIEVVRETGIAELEVQQGENRVKIRSGAQPAQENTVPAPQLGSMGTSSTQSSIAAPASAAASLFFESSGSAASHRQDEDEKNRIVKSPIVGTYYDAPSPGTPPFVKIGDHVEAKQVICIIESMKLMNEIEAEATGVILAKHVENGRPVEYGQALFTIAPL